MNRVFVDASVLFAAAYSATGSARDLIILSLEGKVTLVGSEFVIEEVKRNLAKKTPEKVPALVEHILPAITEIVEAVTKEDVLAAAEYTALKDAPVIAAAKKANVPVLTTYDQKHLLSKPEVAEKSGLQIVTPDTEELILCHHYTPFPPNATDCSMNKSCVTFAY